MHQLQWHRILNYLKNLIMKLSLKIPFFLIKKVKLTTIVIVSAFKKKNIINIIVKIVYNLIIVDFVRKVLIKKKILIDIFIKTIND